MNYVGETAALVTAVCWAASSLTFDAAGRRIGSLSVNWIRLALAMVLLTGYGLIVRGRPLPVDIPLEGWGWLLASGLAGMLFGDLCLFRAFMLIGPRLSSLTMATAPAMAAVIGWLALGERLGAVDIGGIALVIAGIAIAVSAAPTGDASPHRRERVLGVLLALGGALGQSVGFVLSKLGMGKHDPFAANQIRVIAALIGFSVLFTLIRWWPNLRGGVADRRAVRWVALGSVFGPFVGVGLSLVALQHTATGIASSLMATTPIVIIPLCMIVYRQPVGWRGIVGAVIAVCGAVVLFVG